jgi:hypothetical protein
MAVALLLALSWASAVAQSCLSGDEMAQAKLEWAKWIAASSETEAASARARLNIPSTTVGEVTIVTDAATCQKAVQAYATDAGISPSRTVYLVKIGTSYVLTDPNMTFYESYPAIVLDSRFRILTRFTG